MKKKKLSLNDLRVNSFITEVNVKGGYQIVRPAPIYEPVNSKIVSCTIQATGLYDPKCSGIDNCETAWICDPIPAEPIEPLPQQTVLVCNFA